MTVLILAEPRSGSTHLAGYLRFCGFFTFYEPFNKHSQFFLPEMETCQGLDHHTGKKILVKELFWGSAAGSDIHKIDYQKFISRFDYTIFLHRGNFEEQVRSYDFCSTNSLHLQRPYSIPRDYKSSEENIQVFEQLKDEFKEFRANHTQGRYIDISYEELYQFNKIDLILEFLRIEKPKGVTWPYAKKLGSII